MRAVSLPALVWLLGPAGSGKSTWAAEHFADSEVVSSDRLRAVVGTGTSDLDASADAFAILESIAGARLARGLTVVVDSLGFDTDLLERLSGVARQQGIEVSVVAFDTPESLCRERNAARTRPVPARVLATQIKRYRHIREALEEQGHRVLGVETIESVHDEYAAPTASVSHPDPSSLSFYLHVSRFEWTERAELGESLGALARIAEAAGFSGISVMDHLIQIPQVGRAWEAMPESLTTLAFLSGQTQRIRLSALVTNVTLREPVMLGRALATLDVLSGGRVECGLGAGWFEQEQVDAGIPFPDATGRLDRLEDTLRLLPILWGPGAKPFVGSTIEVPSAVCYPRPLQERIPLIVGGRGEARTMRLAAELADGWNLPTSDPGVVESKLSIFDRHCEEVGRDRSDVSVSVLDVTVVGRDRDEVGVLIEGVRGGRPAQRVAAHLRAGTVQATVHRYRELAHLGVDRIYVSFADLAGIETVERFAPVIEAFRSP